MIGVCMTYYVDTWFEHHLSHTNMWMTNYELCKSKAQHNLFSLTRITCYLEIAKQKDILVLFLFCSNICWSHQFIINISKILGGNPVTRTTRHVAQKCKCAAYSRIPRFFYRIWDLVVFGQIWNLNVFRWNKIHFRYPVCFNYCHW